MATFGGRQIRAVSVLLLLALLAVPTCFTGLAPRTNNKTTAQAEAASSSGSSSVALVKVTKENSIATAGVLGGVAGLLLGGFWIGAAGFVATSYLAKKEDDVSTVLKGVSTASLEALNYVDYLNKKYEVTNKVGSAVNDALEKSDSKETGSTVKSTLSSVGDAIEGFDKDVGIKDTLGSLVLAGSDLASQLATKVIELNEEYKVTDQLKAKIDETIDKSKSS
ncbi:Uncharacterized protein SCF082_LOCUS11914 [Durusdinium trenchii]|uniref:Uncharacterized protein n=1 Tax=Durusdinium trenchii TaxID=1381693 RepID=A0ABP0JG69_9DINO